MLGLFSHLFYPWGLILQVIALVHFFRRRPEGFWLWIIFIGGAIGAIAYIIAEMIPDLGLLRGSMQSYHRKSRIQQVEAAIIDNPSVANLEELGELYFDQKNYARARDLFNRAIATRADSEHTFYRRGLCALELGDPNAAIADIEPIVRAEPKFDYWNGAAFLARAYSLVGRNDEADALYRQVIENSTTPQNLYNYAAFLATQNRPADARAALDQLMQKKRTLPRYMQRIERPWFRKGKSLAKQIPVSA